MKTTWDQTIHIHGHTSRLEKQLNDRKDLVSWLSRILLFWIALNLIASTSRLCVLCSLSLAFGMEYPEQQERSRKIDVINCLLNFLEIHLDIQWENTLMILFNGCALYKKVTAWNSGSSFDRSVNHYLGCQHLQGPAKKQLTKKILKRIRKYRKKS